MRGIVHVATSPALRYRPDCPHPAGGRYPALIAIVSDETGAPVAVHRTYLRRDGSGKAECNPQRASLGPIWRGTIRLDAMVSDQIILGEGVETSAAGARLIGVPSWAAISAGNLAHGATLPPEVRRIVIAADADNTGRSAARAAWLRWRREGRQVRILLPTIEGVDCADIIRAQMTREVA